MNCTIGKKKRNKSADGIEKDLIGVESVDSRKEKVEFTQVGNSIIPLWKKQFMQREDNELHAPIPSMPRLESSPLPRPSLAPNP